MRVCVIGLGHVGFPAACVAAMSGHDVVGVDTDSQVVVTLNNGGLHLSGEKGLAQLARSAFESRRLRVSLRPEPAEVFLICVPTPTKCSSELLESALTLDARMGQCVLGESVSPAPETPPNFVCPTADLSFLMRAVEGISYVIELNNLVVVESTVPPGTTALVVRQTIQKLTGLSCGKDFFLAHAPERVLPGDVLNEFISLDRVVGGVDPESTRKAQEFYRTMVRGEVIGTDATTAELVKLMENTYRDVNIALANEFALVCERLGLDVFEAIALANRHPRVRILKPGPGVGGHCVAVDPWFIVQVAPAESSLIRTSRLVNSGMPLHVYDLFKGVVDKRRARGYPAQKVAVLGIAYKPDVGDVRESPALVVVNLIKAAGYDVAIHDPYAYPFRDAGLEEVIQGAHIIILLTDHTVYRGMLQPSIVRAHGSGATLIDTRGFFGPMWDEQGFEVVRLGVGLSHR